MPQIFIFIGVGIELSWGEVADRDVTYHLCNRGQRRQRRTTLQTQSYLVSTVIVRECDDVDDYTWKVALIVNGKALQCYPGFRLAG